MLVTVRCFASLRDLAVDRFELTLAAGATVEDAWQATVARFPGLEWVESNDGHILLAGTLAHIECERYADFPLGDHTLFVGRVTGGAASAGEPLLYYCGAYRTLQP